MAIAWIRDRGGYRSIDNGPFRYRAVSRRGGTLALVIAIHAAILLLLLRLAPDVPAPPALEPAPLVVEMLPGERIAPDPVREATRTPKAVQSGSARPIEQPVTAPPPPRPTPVDPSSDIWKRIIPITGADFAASDVKRSGGGTSAGTSETGSQAGAGDATQSADAGGGGAAGERLYDAEWYRKPRRAELATYLPQGARAGWGMIACRTIANYQVEDCRELGQSTPGLARAVRQAAWQFRVLPPRIGGRPMIGAWVRIRIAYTESAAED